MSDLISRQDALDCVTYDVECTTERIKALPSAQPELIEKVACIRGFERGRTQGIIDAQEAIKIIEVAKAECEWNAPLDYQEAFALAIEALRNFPTQMSGTSDVVSRRMVLDALHEYMDDTDYTVGYLHDVICNLPSAQPEIIHCKECKFAHMTMDGECKYCDVWFPDESEYLDGNYFCASAERREE